MAKPTKPPDAVRKLRHQDKPIKKVKFDPTKSTAWAFSPDDTHTLVVMWDVDHNRYGTWHITLLHTQPDGEIVMKQFTRRQARPEFYGEVVVKGAGRNDLFCSFGVEDDDVIDLDGTCTNKPREIVIYPKRED